MSWLRHTLPIGLLAALLGSSAPAQAGEDFFSTDFMYRLQNDPGFFTFYDISNALAGNGISGASVLQKYGFLGTLPRFDVFYVGVDSNSDLKRTNRYQFNFVGSSFGFRYHLLQEKDGDPLALAIGYQTENYYPGTVFRNGTDLSIQSPNENTQSGFLLASKQITDDLRFNAGVKLGEARAGTLNGYSRSYAAGLEYRITDGLTVQGNYKLIQLEGTPDNNNLALRFNYEPNDTLRLQLHADYYSKGISGLYPVLYPLIPGDFFQRFGEKPQVTYGLQVGLRFGDSAPSSKVNEEEWERSVPAPAGPPESTPVTPLPPTPSPPSSGGEPRGSIPAAPVAGTVVHHLTPPPPAAGPPAARSAPGVLPRPALPAPSPRARPQPTPWPASVVEDSEWDNFEAPGGSSGDGW